MHIEAATRGGKRAYDAGVNIVPYIDMLMTLMIFLMVTAVWTNTRSLDTASTSGGDGDVCPDCVDPVRVRMAFDGGFMVESSPTRDVPTAIELTRHFIEERKNGGAGVGIDVSVDDGVTLDRVAGYLDAAKGAGLATPSLHGVAH